MSFLKKIWKDRQSEYPNRRILTATGNSNEYDISRAEGLILQEGDKLDAETLNDFEQRIEDAFGEVMPKVGGTFTGVVDIKNLFRVFSTIQIHVSDTNFMYLSYGNTGFVISNNNGGQWNELVRTDLNGNITGGQVNTIKNTANNAMPKANFSVSGSTLNISI